LSLEIAADINKNLPVLNHGNLMVVGVPKYRNESLRKSN
jgi:hypothetical protein